jgi:hypothetical protein
LLYPFNYGGINISNFTSPPALPRAYLYFTKGME